MVTHDQSNERVHPYCWKIQFCTPVHERKSGLEDPAMLRLHVLDTKNTHEGVRFNLQMNEQSGGLEKCVKEIDDENSGHSPRIKLSCSSKNNRRATTAFMRRPHAPIFMSTFHAH